MTESRRATIKNKRKPSKPDPAVQLDAQIDESVNALIALVGLRVRTARKEKGLSRRALSELAGVSQRYLAQLESGDGNTSIGLLKRVAITLDLSMQSIIADNDQISQEATEIAELARRADASTRAQARRLLDPGKLRQLKAERVCLVGLRGAGKSTLGALLGKELDVPFIELNSAIESSAGMPVSEIIALYGQEGYRELEAQSLEHIIESEERMVLAVAGGVVSNANTFNKLLSAFHTIWIKTSPIEHMERVRAQGDSRPMADNPQAMMQLRQILKNREALYSQAAYSLDTSGKELDVSFAELCKLIVSEDIVDVESQP